jgi:hypothetical protein
MQSQSLYPYDHTDITHKLLKVALSTKVLNIINTPYVLSISWICLYSLDYSYDPCNSDPCTHGQCTASGGTYQCNCYTGYCGITCDGKSRLFCVVRTCSDSAQSRLLVVRNMTERKVRVLRIRTESWLRVLGNRTESWFRVLRNRTWIYFVSLETRKT